MRPRLPSLALLAVLGSLGCIAAAPPSATPAGEVAVVDLRETPAAPRAGKEAGARGDAAPAPGTAAEGQSARSGDQSPRERAQQAGILGLLRADPEGAASPFGTAWSADDESAPGNLWGDSIGESFGTGGLGIRGAGADGNGTIGLGSLGAIGQGAGSGGTGSGYGSGRGRAGSRQASASRLSTGDETVTGALPKEVIRRIVRQNINPIRFCYEKALITDPKLEGKVVVQFTIGKDGAVAVAQDKGSTLNDKAAVSCVMARFQAMKFPAPEGGGIVIVTYPLIFKSGEPAPPTPAAPATPSSPAPAPKAADGG